MCSNTETNLIQNCMLNLNGNSKKECSNSDYRNNDNFCNFSSGNDLIKFCESMLAFVKNCQTTTKNVEDIDSLILITSYVQRFIYLIKDHLNESNYFLQFI